MVQLQTLLSEVSKHRPGANLDLVKKAYALSKSAHEGQTRKSGDPYFIHPSEVAFILAEHRMDEVTVATGLLHDVVEDTLISLEEIQKELGSEVSDIVDGVTKLSKVAFRSKDERQSESFRKMLLAMAQDIRVMIVKLADRLHNMRTLEHMNPTKRVEIASETLEIYAPLAHRLGISWMKNELEDLAFKNLKPAVYEKLLDLVSASRSNHQSFIDRVIKLLSLKLKTENIDAEVTGRRKHYYSIYKKMEGRNLEYEQIHDILAFRIIVDSIPRCYEALGYIHNMFKPVPGRFKDFIALPKANFYQSLHTTVIGPLGERIEIQIRTREMHQIAEEGIAAHWAYKKGQSTASMPDAQKFGWLRQMVEWQQDLKDANEFIQSVKFDLFSDEVYVFTPKGEVLDFPRGSTPLDFAFRVHSQVGYQCKGAKINGRIVPLKHELRNGDIVEILTDKESHPTKDWLKWVHTSKAKSKIRAFLKEGERSLAVARGKDALIKSLRSHHSSLDRVLELPVATSTLEHYKVTKWDELFALIGYGKISAETIAGCLSGDRPIESLRTRTVTSRKTSGRLSTSGSPIVVGGIDDILVRYGKCCNPVPGDKITGFITRGRGVTIHRADCFKVLEIDSNRKVDVAWVERGQTARTVRIKVVSGDIPGLLAKVSQQITTSGGDISHASIRTTSDKKALLTFDVSISHLSQLHDLIFSIEKIAGVISVERVGKVS